MRGSILSIIISPLLTVPPWLVIGRETIACVSIEESVRVSSDHEIQLWNVLSKLYVYQVARMSQSNNNLNPFFFQFPKKTHSFLPCHATFTWLQLERTQFHQEIPVFHWGNCNQLSW